MIPTDQDAFAPLALAADLQQVHQIYSEFFANLSPSDWDRPAPRGTQEWNLRQTVAHLVSLTSIGNESIQAALREQKISLPIANRYDFSRFNQDEIQRRVHLPVGSLADAFLAELCHSIQTAQSLKPEQANRTVELPIYNRPVSVVEILGIQVFHPGLHHTAQVAEPAGVSPLWTHLTPDTRRRVIERVMRALSILYRHDLAGDMNAVFQFEVAGEGGGAWHVDVSPEYAASSTGKVEHPSLCLGFRSTAVIFKMFTGRINPLLAVLSGDLRLHGDLRLFLKFGSLFSVDARK